MKHADSNGQCPETSGTGGGADCSFVGGRQIARPLLLERIAFRLSVCHTAIMPRGYSRDLRERLLQARFAGVSATEIERTTGVSADSVRRWARRTAAGRSLEPGWSPGRPRRITSAQDNALQTQVAAHPDATLAEHCTRWAESTTVQVSQATMSRSLQRLGLSLKKDPDPGQIAHGERKQLPICQCHPVPHVGPERHVISVLRRSAPLVTFASRARHYRRDAMVVAVMLTVWSAMGNRRSDSSSGSSTSSQHALLRSTWSHSR